MNPESITITPRVLVAAIGFPDPQTEVEARLIPIRPRIFPPLGDPEDN